MIHSATQSAKFVRLVRKLRPQLGSIPVKAETVAVGILEKLWHTTIINCPRGNIGRFDNEMIAESIGWEADADWIIEALLECGWLDPCEDHRLVVHDWCDHAPRHVKQNIARKGGFCQSMSSTTTDGETKRQPEDVKSPLSVSSETESAHTKPNLTKPNLTSDCPSDKARTSEQLFEVTYTPQDVLTHWNQRAKEHPDLKTARALTDERAKHLRARLKDRDWPWREAIDRLPLPIGVESNWQPDLDWLIRNATNAVRIVEGAFDWRAEKSKRPSDSQPRKRLRSIEEEINSQKSA